MRAATCTYEGNAKGMLSNNRLAIPLPPSSEHKSSYVPTTRPLSTRSSSQFQGDALQVWTQAALLTRTVSGISTCTAILQRLEMRARCTRFHPQQIPFSTS